MPATLDALSAQARRCQAASPARQDAELEPLLSALAKDLRAIAGTAARQLGRPAAAEDLYQEACLAVIEGLAHYNAAQGPFKHYALARAKKVVLTQRQWLGALVLPQRDDRRLARLATAARDAFETAEGRRPSAAEWREAMRQTLLTTADAEGLPPAAAARRLRQLNLNAVDPAKAEAGGQSGTVWLDDPGRLKNPDPSARLDRWVQSMAPELDEASDLPLGALVEVLAREAVRLTRHWRSARPGAAAPDGPAALRQQLVLRRLLLGRDGLNLRQAAAELGIRLVLLRKWHGQALHAVRLLRQDPPAWAALLAAARHAARQSDLQAVAPAFGPGTLEPAQRRLALLYALASAPASGRSAAQLYEDLPAHYGQRAPAAREKQLKRDIEELRRQGWAVVSRFQGDGEPHYALADPSPVLEPAFTLSEAEARAVAEALTSPGPSRLAPEQRQALRRLLALRSPLEGPPTEPARSAWPLLLAAIDQGRACDVALKGSATRRSLSPYAWFCHGGRTWIVAWDHTAAALRALDLDALDEARDTAAAFVPAPPGFNPQRWVWEHRPWAEHALAAPLRLQADAAEWARQRWPWVPAQPAPEGAWDLAFSATDPERFVDFLLEAFGSSARLLPQADAGLRKALRQRLEAAR